MLGNWARCTATTTSTDPSVKPRWTN